MKIEGKFFPEGVVKNVHTQICEMLADPEKAKTVHGKIHASNIILFEDGRVEFIEIQSAEEVESSADIEERPEKPNWIARTKK